MAPALAIPLFLLSVGVTLAAAAYFGDRLDHIGPRLGLPEALVGLITALAADAPELSSALIALAQGAKGVSLGVVMGSNAFNLAAMIGLSAILAGAVRLAREALLVEGAMGLLVTLIAAGLVLGALPAGVAIAATVALLVPYLMLLTRGPVQLRRAHAPRAPTHLDDAALWKLASLILAAVALIVLGSAGMVKSALDLADRWNLPTPVVGVLILAILTSLPNAFTAVRLGVGHRGAALVSETLNSNTINLVGGVMVPALVVGLASPSGLVKFDLAWLVAMTSAALLLLARPRGAGPRGGAFLIALYLVFVGVQLAHG